MVKRQQQLSAGGSGIDTDESTNNVEESQPSLSELSEIIREAEIELSIAMASKDQLELVHQRLKVMHADIEARYLVMGQIVNDIGKRELNVSISLSPRRTDLTADFPTLSEPGLFGTQLLLSGEVLPIG